MSYITHRVFARPLLARTWRGRCEGLHGRISGSQQPRKLGHVPGQLGAGHVTLQPDHTPVKLDFVAPFGRARVLLNLA
jgi:hypothetical protein